MYQKKRMLSLFVETPLHAGSGSDLGVVDLPIQRERHTGFPKIEGSSLKGCLREAFETQPDDVVFNGLPVNQQYLTSAVFGPEDTDDAHAGALAVTDARLLLFPVKSMRGVFAWITCPRVLQQFKKDLEFAGIKMNGTTVPSKEGLVTGSRLILPGTKKVILEEYTFELEANNDLASFGEWLGANLLPEGNGHHYWREKMKTDIAILPDDDFADFVNLSTEVITRTKIDNATGTVATGQLFTEEFLPQDSLLYSLALAAPLFQKNEWKKKPFAEKKAEEESDLVIEYLKKGLPKVVQLGGDATIGKGMVSTRIVEVKNEQ